jgi:uncharacterized protein
MAQFADTYFFLALVNVRDQGHAKAIELSQNASEKLVTTIWVLVEFADALAGAGTRGNAARFLRGLATNSLIEISPPSLIQFEQALDLYEERPDKDWSLTDCLSFVVMRSLSILDALAADHHFEQAGFRAIMR